MSHGVCDTTMEAVTDGYKVMAWRWVVPDPVNDGMGDRGGAGDELWACSGDEGRGGGVGA